MGDAADDLYHQLFRGIANQMFAEQDKERKMANETNYPLTVAGLYRNEKSEKLVLSSIPLDQERADQICAMIQQCVGGKLEVREWGGKSKAGKDLPSHKLEGVTAEILAARKAYGEAKKAEQADDAAL